MANSLANPLTSNELTYDLSGLDMNDLWEQNARKGNSYRAVWDEESGQFYMSTVAPHSEMDLALSGQSIDDITTVDYSEPVYFVGAGSHEMGEVSRQWDVQDSGTVNMSEGWMTESELREAWNADEGMGYFKKANPDMDFDAYFNMVKDGTSRYQAAGGLMAGEQENFLAQLAADHGVQTTWTNSDGDVFNFTGGGYAKTVKIDDHAGPGDYMKMAMLAAVGWAAGPAITSALTSSLGAAGAKAASSAIINLAKSYVTTGELSIEDALLSAALSYGGSELSDALQGSGVIGDIGSKITDFGNDLASNGGDILTSALTAGGMSLVTQMVKDGEVDWKDAAIAAAMAGGTTALKGFLADVGKADAEGEVLEEIKVTAQHKGTKVGEDMYQLEDGTVIYAPADGNSNVLGNMADLDTDGDGFLNANDLQEIDVTHDYVDENYVPYKEAYAGKDDVYVDANGRPVDPVGIKYSLNKDGYVDGNGNLVTKVSYGDVYGGNADLGPVDNQGGLVWESHGGTDGVITFEDGRFYAEKVDGQWIGADGQVIDDPRVVDELTLVAAKAIDEPLRQIDYSDANGNVITYSYPPYELRDNFEQGQFSGLIFGPNGETQEVWYDPITNTEYIKAQGTTEIIAIRNPETPPEPVDPQDPDQTYKNQDTTDSSDSKGGGVGDIGSTGDPSTNGTSGPSGSTNPTPNPTTYPELVQIAEIAGITVQEVISRLNSGETVDQITGKGSTPVTPPKTPQTNNDHTLAGGSAGGDTDSGGDTTGDETGDETGGDTQGGGDNTAGDGSGGVDGVSDTGGADAGDDTGGTVTHKIGGGSVAGGVGQGSGAGSGTGTGGGNGNGEGQGDGDGSGNGNGNGSGNGAGDGLGGGGGRDRPEWGPLFPTAPYRPFQRHTPKVARSLFGDLMGLGK